MNKKAGRVTSYVVDSSDRYSIDYLDYRERNRIERLLRSLKTYNMIAYKEYVFEFMKEIKKGNFLGRYNEDEDIYTYYMFSDEVFRKLYGDVKILYRVTESKVILLDLQPSKVLEEGARRLLETYHGTVILDDADKFKIDLLENIK